MNGIIWFCGYRDWALHIYEEISEIVDVPIKLLEGPQEFTEQKEFFTPNDLVLFVGWSWILPAKFVEKYCCVCLHPSPLPKYRGGSPLQHQIINGEKASAVTLFRMDKGVDTGPILSSHPFMLQGSLGEIYTRIQSAGIISISKVIEQYHRGSSLIGTPQKDEEKTYYKRRTPI